MPADEPAGVERPLPDLFRELAADTATLVRQEMQLARAELIQKGKQAGASAGLFGAAAVLALGAFCALTATFIAALALVLPLWAAALITAVAYAGIAAAAAFKGRIALQKVGSAVPDQTAASLRYDAAAIRAAVERGR